MGKQEFDDFLRREESKKEPQKDWSLEKDWWLEQISTLYRNIQSWLKEYTDNKKIEIGFNKIEIYEELLGTYDVKQMTIKISGKIATLTPIGTILIGTKGRIDMIGDAGKVRFILTDVNATKPQIEINVFVSEEEKKEYEEKEKKKSKPQITWVWKITSPPPRIKYTDLNQDTFLESLIRVCNG